MSTRETRFTLTENHLKLMRRMNVGWNGDEFGAPEIDPKRPYGNSDVVNDIAEILGWEPEGGAPYDRELSNRQERTARALHSEMKTALQVVLAAGSFEPGEYVVTQYRDDWRKA